MENVDVSGCGGSGIVDTNTNASGGAITNTSVNSRFDNNFITGSGRYGFYVQDSRNSVTDGFLKITRSRHPGWMPSILIMLRAGISQVITCIMTARGISASRLFGTTIASNYIEDFGDGKRSGTWYGVIGTARTGTALRSWETRSSTCWASRPVPPTLYWRYTGKQWRRSLSVTGNVILGDRRGDVGISLSGGQNKLDVAASGNQVSGVGKVMLKGGTATVTAGS